MLYIEQASAGSGKTFALAKTYIRNLLAERPEGEARYRLRDPKAMHDVHGRIMAVTFTNKATNEMKQRIVESLAAMASATPDMPDDKKHVYLKEFAKEFEVDEQRIINQAQVALVTLLHGYADFRVSTIDSFFQTVMRSFTAEIDELSDGYQVELDDKMLSRRAVDATMSQLRENDENRKYTTDLRHWIQLLVDRNFSRGEHWNPFSNRSVYGKLKSFAELTESEEFKRHEQELSKYFEQLPVRFIEVYKAILAQAEQDRHSCHDKVVQAYKRASELDGFAELLVPSGGIAKRGLPNFLQMLPEMVRLHYPTGNLPKGVTLQKICKGEEDIYQASKNRKGELTEQYPGLNEAVVELINAAYRWVEIDQLWEISTNKMPMLALLNVVMENKLRFQDENNLLPLSSTNRILRSIICEEDAPFIYERIGAYIDHYLIDEFQDTSLMQWSNFRPLLLESLSRAQDNLIIGDVKQSIYRFRNAEPKLIAEIVPSDSALDIAPDANGRSSSRSTNWRSAREIVRFNNTIFHLLANNISEEVCYGADLKGLYSNVVQNIRRSELPGYVRIEFEDLKPEEGEGSIERVPQLIREIMSRGYSQRDIAILVNKRDQGLKVIETIIDDNSRLEPGITPISIVSDESLRISSSDAVQIIISVLEMMRRPLREKERRTNLNLLIGRYHQMRRNDPEIPFDDIVQQHVDNVELSLGIDEMLGSLKSLSLPSLVEAIAGKYLSEEMRVKHTAYLAAFQDLVLDYCETQPADVATFLTWWYDFGVAKSINSPETADAVKIMTIHKSKGLEFKCVIIPQANWAFAPSNRDTLWVKPSLPSEVETDGMPLPPVIAVKAESDLLASPYAEEYREYCRQSVIESLNKTYVAFTRAKRELYVFAAGSKKGESNYLGDMLKAQLPLLFKPEETSDSELHIHREDWNEVTPDVCYEYGSLTSPRDESKSESESESESESKSESIAVYHVFPERDLLYTTQEDADDDDEAIDEDATILGETLHSVMSRVMVVSDLQPAMLRAQTRGQLTETEAAQWLDLIERQLDKPEIAAWFKPGLSVFNERKIYFSDKRGERPDRFIVDAEGNAIVIDYKFGQSQSRKYHEQVQGYVDALRRTGHYRSVSGYLWYVAIEKTVCVCPTAKSPSNKKC